MQGTTWAGRGALLSVTGVLEAATGFSLLSAPSWVAAFLLGAAPASSAGMMVGRVAGLALLTLGVACWVARGDAVGRAATGLIAAMCLYNLGTVALIVHAWAGLALFGLAFWPVILVHMALAAWCIACLLRPAQGR